MCLAISFIAVICNFFKEMYYIYHLHSYLIKVKHILNFIEFVAIYYNFLLKFFIIIYLYKSVCLLDRSWSCQLTNSKTSRFRATTADNNMTIVNRCRFSYPMCQFYIEMYIITNITESLGAIR